VVVLTDLDDLAPETYGYPLAGLFGFSHITGGYAGGQAEYLRVPYADVHLTASTPTGPQPQMATVSSGPMSQCSAAW
jgi:threonine dehydrogenase-like Zn-dependent dehydrogenase